MKSYDEIAKSVFERRDAYLTKKKKRQRIFYYSITSLCILAVVSVSLYLPLKPQETIKPSIQSHPSFGNSSNNSYIELNSSQATSSLPLENNSSTPAIESTVTSLPSIGIQESNSKPETESKTEVQQEQISSSVSPLRPNTSKPIEYQINFSTLKEFSSFLPQLNIQVEKPSVDVDTSIPEINTPAPDAGFWDEMVKNDDVNAPPDEDTPGAEAPGDNTSPDVSLPKPPSNEEIWDSAKDLFSNGYYCVPYLQNGNDLLYLDKIFVQSNTIKYNYKFHNVSGASSNDILSVQLSGYSIQHTYETYLSTFGYRILKYNGITYTVFRLTDNPMYDACVIWEQNGFHCRANFQGDNQYLSSIIPNLYLIQIPWA